MNIYTKLGDKGFTSLPSGDKVRKDNYQIEVIGELDELNSHIGLLLSMMDDSHNKEFLYFLQNLLFDLSSSLFNNNYNFESHCLTIEHEIDLMQTELPHLHSFILPGGCMAAAQAHICRSVCRRVERRVVSLTDNVSFNASSICILNRISDYFYILARKINFVHGITEKKWQNTCE